jgi:hypothetical protein
MFRETQNLKDSSRSTSLTLKDNSLISLSYNKTNKLIAGLYMVTDILDRDEPMRHRLRFLGAGIISDIHILSSSVNGLNIKIDEVLSLLDVSSLVGIISQMNASILRKEFLLLKESIEEASSVSLLSSPQMTLSEFMQDLPKNIEDKSSRPAITSIGHSTHTRIGVQKGHTLMKALSDKVATMSDKNHTHLVGEKFDSLRKERREKIVKIVRNNPNGTSIKDIVLAIRNLGGDMGEKTLQRELIGMVKDGVLNKTGEKRWSRYFLAS